MVRIVPLVMVLAFVWASSPAAESIVTPLFPHKDGDASSLGEVIGSEKELVVDDGNEAVSKAWIIYQTAGVELPGVSKAVLNLYVKEVVQGGMIEVYALKSAVEASEFSLSPAALEGLVDTGTVVASAEVKAETVEKVVRLDVTAAVTADAFHGLALVGVEGLRVAFDSKEGPVKPMIMLTHDMASAGSTWHTGSGAPAAGLGADGDMYLDTQTGNAYTKADGAWNQAASLKGPRGEPGADGTDGTPGTSSWTDGEGVVTTSSAVGIGTGSPESDLDLRAAGSCIAQISTSDSGESVLQIGPYGTGNRHAYIDLVGDETYTDFGTRLIRQRTGPNAPTVLEHRGTGPLMLIAREAGDILLRTSNAERMRITPDGDVGIGTSAPQARLDVSGDVRVTGSISTTDWTGVSFGTGWRNESNGYQECEYRKIGDMVYLRGLARNNGTWSDSRVICTLPEGFRPPARLIFSPCVNNTTGRVDVAADGAVRWGSGGGTTGWISLDGISFSTK